MELREGYKQTEVGVIPEGWECRPAGTLGRFRGGTGFPIRFQGHGEGDYPFFKVSDMNREDNGTFMQTANHYISEEIRRQLGAVVFPPDSIVFAKVGAAVFLERKKILSVPSCLDNNMAAFVLDRDITDVRFVHYWLLQFQLASLVATTALPALSNGVLNEVPIPLPPTKAEQEAIADALSDADALIASLEQLIAKKRCIKQGAMQELLTGKRRLPGFSGNWEEKTLGELGKCYRGVSYSPSDLSEQDTSSTVRLLRANNVQNSSIVFSDMQYVEAARVSEYQNLREKDVLICMANGSRQLVGKAGQYFSSDGYEYTFGAFMAAFRPDPTEADSDYVFMLFSTEAYRNHIDLLLAGSSINNLTPSSVEELKLLMPQADEQTAIATVLSEMNDEIRALEAKISKARLLKQGMMQELLTGRIRLV